MRNLIEKYLNKITKCADGAIRRLTEIQPQFLFYEVPLDIEFKQWMHLGAAIRGQVEQHFLNGQILTEKDISNVGTKLEIYFSPDGAIYNKEGEEISFDTFIKYLEKAGIQIYRNTETREYDHRAPGDLHYKRKKGKCEVLRFRW
jgi:hypothetical protein